MADSSLTPAKVILLAVQVAIRADIQALRTLVARHRKSLHTILILRILLTYLPESLDSSEYVGLLQDIASGHFSVDEKSQVDTSLLEEISNEDALKKVRKLHLLPLIWPSAPPGTPDDPLVLFLIHRAYRIDEETGLITQLPELMKPFLHHSEFLRTWVISILLPLLRLNYEFYPQESTIQSIASFEALEDWAGVDLLLSKTGKIIDDERESRKTAGRDLRGLVGPWLYGDTRWKVHKIKNSSSWEGQTIAPLDGTASVQDDKFAGWEEVFKWIISQATSSWNTCVEAIDQWDGPGDVDFGDYGDGSVWLEEHEQKFLERRYGRGALAAAYLIPVPSVEALMGVQRILSRLTQLLDYDRLPTLPAAAALLSPISVVSANNIANIRNATYLRTGLMEERNVLTTPDPTSISFLHCLLISAFLLTRAGVQCTIRHAGELILFQDEREQEFEARRLIQKVGNGPKGDDKYWIRMRREILWLQDWGIKSAEVTEGSIGKGIFGKVKKELLEMEILKALLANTRYTLARSIYETSPERPLSAQQIQDTVIAAAMNAYDNATNANRTRGGVKKCDEIIHAFPDTIKGSLPERRIDHLLMVTHSIGNYRLVLKQGEPFTPVNLRVHGDPVSIVGKILDQNPNAYTKINDIIFIGEQMVLAGLTIRDVEGHSVMEPEQEEEQLSIVRKRVTSMCIDAALADDDFETAYSYVMTRLPSVASEAQARTPILERQESGIFAHPPPRMLDDWSWRAALQAGKYRFNRNTVKPTHLGNTSGNLDIRHLEQRKDCLSQALRIAPPSTLQEILNAFRRCEEELDTKVKEEAAQEAAWDQQGDETLMPGGFGPDPPEKALRAITARTLASEEAPMSLFDLTRASAAKAQSSLSALSSLTRGTGRGAPSEDDGGAGEEVAYEHGVGQRTVRKRDQLRNAAVGTLASGIGWLINAPTPPPK